MTYFDQFLLFFALILSTITIFQCRADKKLSLPTLEMVISSWLLAVIPVVNVIAFIVIFTMGVVQIIRGEL